MSHSNGSPITLGHYEDLKREFKGHASFPSDSKTTAVTVYRCVKSHATTTVFHEIPTSWDKTWVVLWDSKREGPPIEVSGDPQDVEVKVGGKVVLKVGIGNTHPTSLHVGNSASFLPRSDTFSVSNPEGMPAHESIEDDDGTILSFHCSTSLRQTKAAGEEQWV